jgi:hypothetical protein
MNYEDCKNTTTLVEKMINDGKAKIGKCDASFCSNEDLLYKVSGKFICGNCLDKLDKEMEKRGMK